MTKIKFQDFYIWKAVLTSKVENATDGESQVNTDIALLATLLRYVAMHFEKIMHIEFFFSKVR